MPNPWFHGFPYLAIFGPITTVKLETNHLFALFACSRAFRMMSAALIMCLVCHVWCHFHVCLYTCKNANARKHNQQDTIQHHKHLKLKQNAPDAIYKASLIPQRAPRLTQGSHNPHELFLLELIRAARKYTFAYMTNLPLKYSNPKYKSTENTTKFYTLSKSNVTQPWSNQDLEGKTN